VLSHHFAAADSQIRHTTAFVAKTALSLLKLFLTKAGNVPVRVLHALYDTTDLRG
jgi:hypothetical protein